MIYRWCANLIKLLVACDTSNARHNAKIMGPGALGRTQPPTRTQGLMRPLLVCASQPPTASAPSPTHDAAPVIQSLVWTLIRFGLLLRSSVARWHNATLPLTADHATRESLGKLPTRRTLSAFSCIDHFPHIEKGVGSVSFK